MDSAVHNEAPAIQLVTSTNSPEFDYLSYALIHSSVIGLDAEWKPNRHAASFPAVELLQIACRLVDPDELQVFLLDLQEIHLPEVYGLLRDMFVSPGIVKLGFRFKQDLVYLSSTFSERGCDPGFDRVEPFIDITAIYNYLRPKQAGQRIPKQNKSLATICNEVLGILLLKELQCSDWSKRPLTEEQKAYAAADAHCLIEIFNVLCEKVVREGLPSQNQKKCDPFSTDAGLNKILDMPNASNLVTRTMFSVDLNLVRTTIPALENGIQMIEEVEPMKPCNITKHVDSYLPWIIRKHGDKLLLIDADRRPKNTKKKTKKPYGDPESKRKTLEISEDWQGPAPWDPSFGGDGCPKFLCDVMVEGLAKHLRCVGMDAAIPQSKKPDSRDLIDQAQKEKRVLLTRDVKLLRYEYLIKNQVYRIRNLLKNDQLVEVIEAFQLKISEDQLMSRCTKCNGSFIQKPLTTEEAVEAAKGFQVIPNCLFNKNLEFWQCMDCHQLYWEGTQYRNAVQKFIDVCKLNE